MPRAILILLVSALALPIVITVMAGCSMLLAQLGDETGASVVRWIAGGCGLAWVLNLIALILVQAFGSLRDPSQRKD